MPGRVFVTGASGFVGTAIVEQLVARGYEVSALVHHRRPTEPDRRVRQVSGSLLDSDLLLDAIRDCQAVIHIVGIIMQQPGKGITFERIHFQGTKSVVDATVHAGVKRYVHMSALGTRPDAVSDYHKTKYKAEQYVRSSGLDWTIVRPSMIHGPGGELMQMEAAWARKKAPPPLFFMPFMPYFGGNKAGRLQPVYVGDVARAFVDALEKPQTIGEVYMLGGPDRLTWPELHRTVSNAMVGKDRMVASMPVPVAKTLAALGVGKLLGFNRDQVIMSQEDNTCDLTKFVDHFGWEPKPFAETVRGYAKQL